MPTAKRVLVQLSRRHTCQAGVNSCQVGLWSAPLPRARAAEGGPHTYVTGMHGYRYGMVEVCEGAPVAVSGWVLADAELN